MDDVKTVIIVITEKDVLPFWVNEFGSDWDRKVVGGIEEWDTLTNIER